MCIVSVSAGRTFPAHPYFSTALGPGQLALFNLLKAYSLLDKEVGYCQGLSFVAGILLMHVSEAFSPKTEIPLSQLDIAAGFCRCQRNGLSRP